MTALDVPQQQEPRVPLAARLDRVTWLIAHPEAVATAPHATDGEAAELRHWLYDADADDTTRPFVDLRKGRKL